jgi:thioredoxin-dependent peroxiredoxin
MALPIGTKAPKITTLNDEGKTVSLTDYKGQKIALFFYPEDDTCGCAKEVQNFRDHYQSFIDAEITVLGISFDGVESHQKFKAKYSLPFTLLTDTDHKIAQLYDVDSGEGYALRTTFIIDENGIISYVEENVKPDNHAVEILAVCQI